MGKCFGFLQSSAIARLLLHASISGQIILELFGSPRIEKGHGEHSGEHVVGPQLILVQSEPPRS